MYINPYRKGGDVSDTPRTDAVHARMKNVGVEKEWLALEAMFIHARELERELHAWKIGAHSEQERALRCENGRRSATLPKCATCGGIGTLQVRSATDQDDGTEPCPDCESARPEALLKEPVPLPPGCHCEPGRCMAPRIMDVQTLCRDPQKAAQCMNPVLEAPHKKENR